MINMEQPAAVNELLARFLEQLPPTANESHGGPDEHHTSHTTKRS
jgi:hypothetical protein